MKSVKDEVRGSADIAVVTRSLVYATALKIQPWDTEELDADGEGSGSGGSGGSGSGGGSGRRKKLRKR